MAATAAYREVVANQVPVPLAGVELDSKASRISEGLGAAPLVDDCGEAHDDGRLHAGRAEHIGTGVLGDVMGDLKEALGRSSTSVHNALCRTRCQLLNLTERRKVPGLLRFAGGLGQQR